MCQSVTESYFKVKSGTSMHDGYLEVDYSATRCTFQPKLEK